MKRLFFLIVALTFALVSFAQTPEETVDRMSEDVKIPILGTMSTVAWSQGVKMRMEAEAIGKKIITWMNNGTDWTYTAEDDTNTVQDRDAQKPSSEQENMTMLDSVTEGYGVFMKKETDTAWYLQCKKNKTNTNKDAP